MKAARALLILAALAASPTSANPAVPKGCEFIAAMARSDVASLRGIRLDVDTNGLIDLSYRGKRSQIAGATDCELSGPNDIFDVNCSWDLGFDLDAAKRQHAKLLNEFERCVPDELERRDYTSSVANLIVSENFEGQIERSDGSAMRINLKIYTFLGNVEETERHSVDLSISR